MQGTYDVKRLFPFFFTLEMIKHTGTGELVQLEEILEKRDNLMKEVIKKNQEEKIPRKKPTHIIQRKKIGIKAPELKPIQINKPVIPPELQHLKPALSQRKIDLGKLNLLISDHGVKAIECPGPGKNISVMGKFGAKKTGIILNKEEINEIIEKFSKIARIPTSPGVSKIIIKGLLLIAIVSDVIDSKFIIQKINPLTPNKSENGKQNNHRKN